MSLPVKQNTAFAAALSNAITAVSVDDATLLKMEKTGDWIFGADEQEVSPESIWAIDPESLSRGYVSWGDAEVLGEEMALITDTPIIMSELPDTGEKWAQIVAMTLKCVDGDHLHEVVTYKASSKGGQKAFKTLVTAILGRVNAGETDLVALVALESDSYKHKTYGKIHNPVLVIKEWTNMAELTGQQEEEPTPEPEEVKKPTRKKAVKKPAPEPEPEEDEAPKPARRRRRAT